jgi:hypothetical protein
MYVCTTEAAQTSYEPASTSDRLGTTFFVGYQMAELKDVKLFVCHEPGLPDSSFSNQKSQFG